MIEFNSFMQRETVTGFDSRKVVVVSWDSVMEIIKLSFGWFSKQLLPHESESSCQSPFPFITTWQVAW